MFERVACMLDMHAAACMLGRACSGVHAGACMLGRAYRMYAFRSNIGPKVIEERRLLIKERFPLF